MPLCYGGHKATDPAIMGLKQPKPPFFPLNSSQVLLRFFFRVAVLCAFSTLGAKGFAPAFAALSALSALFCGVVGAMRREAVFGPALTNWDEAAAYLLLGRLAALV